MELWQLHLIFMIVFFGLPISLGYYKYREWKKNGNESLIERIKKDLGMDF